MQHSLPSHAPFLSTSAMTLACAVHLSVRFTTSGCCRQLGVERVNKAQSADTPVSDLRFWALQPCTLLGTPLHLPVPMSHKHM